MKPILYRGQIEVKKSTVAGLGVFANVDFEAGAVIEECVLIKASMRDKALNDYYFNCRGAPFLALGAGSLYNHADKPNAAIVMDVEKRCMTVIALRPIKAREEIFISYGETWFSSRNAVAKRPSLFYQIKAYFHHQPQPIRLLFITIFYLAVIYLANVSFNYFPGA